MFYVSIYLPSADNKKFSLGCTIKVCVRTEPFAVCISLATSVAPVLFFRSHFGLQVILSQIVSISSLLISRHS